ncbi:ParB/RepB/Spo0J family partition protein [Actinomadura nitritigenes]|uniref:ParB/RepB/Spo0J family partition protein n=1 Tax=Actinomadura nitritigenes TaxID=134602 RepID=A0ABS3QTY5_9ACTN|nr:ParB/RepB/Spo0J family partition protein [Actinomadura nitritigenes]MBO2437441.1 ParB/RepB/Spo0J family partition protein [Actinomadura nitritigenes]
MSQQRRGLGKGLGALIPTAPPPPPADDPSGAGGTGALGGPGFPGGPNGPGQDGAASPDVQPVAGAHFAELPVTSITANPRQPREHFDEQALEELAESIGIVGLLQPIVVRRADSGEHDYELIMGERRLRASQMAGLDVIPAIVRDTGDNDLLRDALMENLHRQQLNPLEEAAAYQQLLQDFGATHEQLAGRIGRSRPHITNTLRLLNLPPAVQRRVAAGVLSAGHARALLSLDSVEAQEHMAQRIVQEGLSVRAVEEMIALREVEDAPKATRQGRRKKPVAPGLQELADRLSDRYETKVRVDMGRNKGKIVVEFATLEDLDRIIKSMAPDDDRPGEP